MHPTASSTPAPGRSSSSTPAACDRSQIVVAPCAAARAGFAGEVGHLRSPVVDERAQHDVDAVEIVEPVPDLDVPQPGDALDDVPIGREVAVVDGDHPSRPADEVERDVDLLEDPDRGRFVDGDLARPGAEQRGEFVADARASGSASRAPTTTRSGRRPIASTTRCSAVDRALRGAAERVAVEVDQLGIGDHELVAPAREGIGSVERECIGRSIMRHIRSCTAHSDRRIGAGHGASRRSWRGGRGRRW